MISYWCIMVESTHVSFGQVDTEIFISEGVLRCHRLGSFLRSKLMECGCSQCGAADRCLISKYCQV